MSCMPYHLQQKKNNMNIKENIKTLIVEKPLKLDCGQIINNFPLAY